MTTFIFLIVLAVLIFVHELGHFLIARSFGIRVDEFALGFGPKIISKKVDEVVYSLNLIPFGGYVKIFGENPDDESIAGPDKKRSFVHKPKLQQISVLFAGILFNFLFAWLLLCIAFSSGVLASSEDYPQYRKYINDEHILITSIAPDSPAEKAGLKPGDILKAASSEEVQEKIQASMGNVLEIAYNRGGIDSLVKVKAEKGIIPDQYAIGITMEQAATMNLPIHLAFIESWRFTFNIIDKTFIGLGELISGMFKGTAELGTVAGPVGIAHMIGDAAKLGLSYLLMFTAIISINLGVLNMIPFPALDGGRILFVIIETIMRKPIKPVIANTVNAIGFSLLILLMIVVTYRDIAKFF